MSATPRTFKDMFNAVEQSPAYWKELYELSEERSKQLETERERLDREYQDLIRRTDDDMKAMRPAGNTSLHRVLMRIFKCKEEK